MDDEEAVVIPLDDDPFASSTPPPRPRSSGHGQRRPAHTRPAFAPRPSLPSLHTLAQMNMTIPGRSKIRKGTPGAGLPHEPWNMDLSPFSEPLQTRAHPRTCFNFSQVHSDDADMDSLPSQPSSSAFSPTVLTSSSSSSPDINTPTDTMNSHSSTTDNIDHVVPDEDDPLSYHSDFDYYTQSFSDLSDSESDRDTSTAPAAVTPHCSLIYDPLLPCHNHSPNDSMPPPHHPQSVTHPKTLDLPHVAHPWRGVPISPRGRQDDGRRRPDDRHPTSTHTGDRSRGNDNPRHGKSSSSPSSTSDYTSSSDDDADGITVYYSLDGMSNGPPSRPHSRTRSRHSKAGGGSDDDVPLAQRVPTALSAQRSIRKQLHDERQQRRLDRAKSSRKSPVPPLPFPQTDLVPPSAAPTRFRKRSVSAAPAPVAVPRTLPMEAFPAEDLTRKLMNLQASYRPPPPTASFPYESSMPPTISTRVPGHASALSRSSSRGRHTDHATYLQQKSPRIPEPSTQDRPLRSMRSFHRPDGRNPETPRPPNDQTSAPRLGRSTTAAASSRPARVGHETPLVGHEQPARPGRVAEHGRRPSAGIPRSSVDRENDIAQRVVQRPPVPPVPIVDSTPPHQMSRGPVVQQRIFIGDMQRFNLVEITPVTNAGDVIDTVATQGMVDRSGSWMVFEMAQDYGMERPIRDYELLADVSASWNKDKLLNAFVIKQTPLAELLSRSALPTSSPTHRGWVEWESKRGKWSKRWMELREHGLWLSKRETGKDEVFLCSLSSFDAYLVTRRHKSPKVFMFAVKSTDHPSLFENVADYLHTFSCNPKDGEKWVQAILVARSYVLYQERNVLFAKTGEVLSQAKPLTRSRTRKQSVSARPAQPLVNVPPPFSQASTANIAFEPGSLLAKRKGDVQL